MSDSTLNWCIGGATLINFVVAIKVGLDDGIIQPFAHDAIVWIAFLGLKLAGAL